jgi:hypothetical protein
MLYPVPPLPTAQPISALFERHGFRFGNTGGSCTAFIRVLPNGNEIWVICEADVRVPEELHEQIVVGMCPLLPNGEVREGWSEETEWKGTAGEYLALLDAVETVLGF